MLILKHLKTLQHVSIIIQIIFRDFVGYLLNSLNLTRNLRTLKNTPTCFDHYSDHLQGFRRFLVKFTEFNKELTNT